METELNELKGKIAAKEEEMTLLYLQHQAQNDFKKNTRYSSAAAHTKNYTLAIQKVQEIMEKLANELNKANQIRRSYVDERNAILEEFPLMSESIKTLDEFVIRSDKAYRESKRFQFPDFLPMLRPGELPWWIRAKNDGYQNRYTRQASYKHGKQKPYKANLPDES